MTLKLVLLVVHVPVGNVTTPWQLQPPLMFMSPAIVTYFIFPSRPLVFNTAVRGVTDPSGFLNFIVITVAGEMSTATLS